MAVFIQKCMKTLTIECEWCNYYGMATILNARIKLFAVNSSYQHCEPQACECPSFISFSSSTSGKQLLNIKKVPMTRLAVAFFETTSHFAPNPAFKIRMSQSGSFSYNHRS